MPAPQIRAGFDAGDPATWPPVMTVDEVSAIDRHENRTVKEARRAVYDAVRNELLRPVHGLPNGHLSLALRFSRREVMRYVGLIEADEPMVEIPRLGDSQVAHIRTVS